MSGTFFGLGVSKHQLDLPLVLKVAHAEVDARSTNSVDHTTGCNTTDINTQRNDFFEFIQDNVCDPELIQLMKSKYTEEIFRLTSLNHQDDGKPLSQSENLMIFGLITLFTIFFVCSSIWIFLKII